MVNRVWLVLDMNNLAWRAFHKFKGLKFGAYRTGVVFGVLRDIQYLSQIHATKHLVFCFDSARNMRKEAFAQYKKEREEKLEELSEEDKEIYADLYRQIKVLRTKYLPRLGFKNIFHVDGYEGDDIIASVCKRISRRDEAVIVSTDGDMLQLLRSNVLVWHPVLKKSITAESFEAEYGIKPYLWARVKALSGCKTDGVPGIKGIGEAYAIAALKGKHPPGSRIGDLIGANEKLYKRNLQLVKLPLEGCPKFKLIKDQVKPIAWGNLTRSLGMTSLSKRPPGSVNGFGLRPKKLKGIQYG